MDSNICLMDWPPDFLHQHLLVELAATWPISMLQIDTTRIKSHHIGDAQPRIGHVKSFHHAYKEGHCLDKMPLILRLM